MYFFFIIINNDFVNTFQMPLSVATSHTNTLKIDTKGNRQMRITNSAERNITKSKGNYRKTTTVNNLFSYGKGCLFFFFLYSLIFLHLFRLFRLQATAELSRFKKFSQKLHLNKKANKALVAAVSRPPSNVINILI